ASGKYLDTYARRLLPGRRLHLELAHGLQPLGRGLGRPSRGIPDGRGYPRRNQAVRAADLLGLERLERVVGTGRAPLAICECTGALQALRRQRTRRRSRRSRQRSLQRFLGRLSSRGRPTCIFRIQVASQAELTISIPSAHPDDAVFDAVVLRCAIEFAE